jgi:quaternary ammonium compound-resistance protein SugE
VIGEKNAPDEVNRTRRVKTGLQQKELSMSTTWSWIVLVIAGLLEVCWAIGLKYTEGFTKLVPSVFTLVTLAASMFLLAKASQALPIGTAYGVWVGIGALGAAILGIFLFGEPASPARILFLGLLLVSIIGLKLTAK